LRNKLLFNILVKNLVVLKTRLFFNPKVLSFCEVLNKAKRVLILLPTKAESFPKALNHLGSLSAFVSDSEKFLFLPFQQEGFSSHLKNYRMIILKKSDLNWFSLPNKEFIQRLKNLRFDITIDLDLEKNFLNSYLSFLSGSPLRIGVKNKAGLPFYNFEISLSEDERYLDELYESFTETLIKFNNFKEEMR